MKIFTFIWWIKRGVLILKIENIIQKFLQKNNKLSFEKDGYIAINKLKSFNDEVVLSGNKLGLILFADYVLSVALSSGEGCHIHLDENNFFDMSDKKLIIELEDSEKQSSKRKG